MVQFQLWQERKLITGTGDTHLHPRWVGHHGGAPAETRYVWPFADTNWLGSRWIVYTQNGNNISEFSRTLNGSDVGTKFSVGNNQPPVVPVTITDGVIVAVVKGDLIGMRMSSTVSGGSHPTLNFTSFFEFADGLWGF